MKVTRFSLRTKISCFFRKLGHYNKVVFVSGHTAYRVTEILVKIIRSHYINVPDSGAGRRTAAATDTLETDSDPEAVGPGGIMRMT